MHPEEQGFHTAILENPEDETASLVYADWLEDQGRPTVAEVIRKHIKGAQDSRTNGYKSQYTGAFVHPFDSEPETQIGYATPYGTSPDVGKDMVSVQIPSLGKRTLRYTAWLPRTASKRVVPQLVKEGYPLAIKTQTREHTARFNADTTTVPETHQMSRRNSLKKYAATTVSRAMGLGSNAKDMAPTTVGSRLATVLREIKHSPAHKDNSRLQSYLGSALKGDRRSDVYTGIRDELFRSKDPRAVQLARMYNWHKVGEGLEREKHLRDFVNNAAKGTRHAGSSQMFRQFYNQTVHQVNSRGEKGGADDRTRALMYRAMQKHLMNQTGKEHSYTDIEDALRRLGETEENQEKAKGQHGGAKFESPDYEHPAYTGTPKPNHAPDKRQVTDISKRAPGQYRRHRRFNIK